MKSESKKLTLGKNKLIGGVIAGCAEYFDHDPTVWRIVSIILLVLTGLMPGVLLYALMWLVMPNQRKDDEVRDAEYTVLD